MHPLRSNNILSSFTTSGIQSERNTHITSQFEASRKHPSQVWLSAAMPKHVDRERKNHDSQRRDRILRFSLRPENGLFSPDFGAVSLLNYTEHPENSTPKLQDSVPFRGRTRPELIWLNLSISKGRLRGALLLSPVFEWHKFEIDYLGL